MQQVSYPYAPHKRLSYLVEGEAVRVFCEEENPDTHEYHRTHDNAVLPFPVHAVLVHTLAEMRKRQRAGRRYRPAGYGRQRYQVCARCQRRVAIADGYAIVYDHGRLRCDDFCLDCRYDPPLGVCPALIAGR